MKLFFYQLFYKPTINYCVRNFLKLFAPILPNSLKIPVSGKIKIKVNDTKQISFQTNETSPMTKILFWEDRGCTFEFSHIFKHIIQSSSTFFDVGANIGYYSLLAKSLNPSIDVFSFEPSKGPNFFLRQNIKLNHFDSIHIIEKAVGSEPGAIEFYEEKNPKYAYQKYHASGIGNTANTWGINNFLKYQVELTTLDHISNEFELKQLDLIKIDTEGTENFVFQGAKETIERFKPIIICEVLPNKIEKEIQSIIDQLNYMMFQFQSNLNCLLRIDNLSEATLNGETNYFFVPTEKEFLISDFVSK